MSLRSTLLFVLIAASPSALSGQVSDRWSERGLEDVVGQLDSLGTAAFIIMTDGETVVSWGDTGRPYRMHSVRKSLLSALVGISVAQGEMLTSLSLEDLGINDKGLLTPTERSATVEQLLASRSGVYHPAASETREAIDSRPSRGAFLPGEHWYYNNWDFNALGTIYASARGQTVGDAFRDRIARPVGMRDFDVDDHFAYHLEPHHSRHPSYRFRLSARDLALFGQLYLQAGRWGERQVVPSEWVHRSTEAISHTGRSGTKGAYGLMWWVASGEDPAIPAGSFTASGSGGQRLTVIPGIGTVVVHLMDTDRSDGRRIGSAEYDRLLRLLMDAWRAP